MKKRPTGNDEDKMRKMIIRNWILAAGALLLAILARLWLS